MPKSKKKPAKRRTKTLLPKVIKPAKSRLDPKQIRMPNSLRAKGSKSGKPMLFPGRTGGR